MVSSRRAVDPHPSAWGELSPLVWTLVAVHVGAFVLWIVLLVRGSLTRGGRKSEAKHD